MHLACGKEPARGIGVINLAPLLVKQVANTAFLGSDLFQVIEAVEQKITEVGDIRFALDPQMHDASASERIMY